MKRNRNCRFCFVETGRAIFCRQCFRYLSKAMKDRLHLATRRRFADPTDITHLHMCVGFIESEFNFDHRLQAIADGRVPE